MKKKSVLFLFQAKNYDSDNVEVTITAKVGFDLLHVHLTPPNLKILHQIDFHTPPAEKWGWQVCILTKTHSKSPHRYHLCSQNNFTFKSNKNTNLFITFLSHLIVQVVQRLSSSIDTK